MKIYPVRVVVRKDGLAVPPSTAEKQYRTKADVVFIRDDGWSLGAPKKFEEVAYSLWTDKWVAFAYHGEQVRPMGYYQYREQLEEPSTENKEGC